MKENELDQSGNEFEDIHKEVAEVFEQGIRGDYTDIGVPIDRATAEYFHDYLTGGIISVYEYYEEEYPGQIYEAQRECSPEGLYKSLAKKFESVSLQQHDEWYIALNSREINTLGQTLFADHIRLELEDQRVLRRHQFGATMFLDLARDFTDAGGSFEPFFEDYFIRVTAWFWECNRDNPEDIFGGDYEL